MQVLHPDRDLTLGARFLSGGSKAGCGVEPFDTEVGYRSTEPSKGTNKVRSFDASSRFSILESSYKMPDLNFGEVGASSLMKVNEVERILCKIEAPSH